MKLPCNFVINLTEHNTKPFHFVWQHSMEVQLIDNKRRFKGFWGLVIMLH